MNRIVLHDTSPVIIIDGSVLIISTYFGMIGEYEKSDIPSIMSEKTEIIPQTASKRPLDYYKLLHTNPNFIKSFMKAIERNIIKICHLATQQEFRGEKYKFGNAIIVKDCSRKDNWRTHLDITYKAHRLVNDKFDPKIIEPFWEEIFPLLKASKGFKVLALDNIEADDLAYLAKTKIREIWPQTKIKIVTIDKDYLQLEDSLTRVVDIKGEHLTDYGDRNLNLAMKILTGDTSDNIPQLFDGCSDGVAKNILDILAKDVIINQQGGVGCFPFFGKSRKISQELEPGQKYCQPSTTSKTNSVYPLTPQTQVSEQQLQTQRNLSQTSQQTPQQNLSQTSQQNLSQTPKQTPIITATSIEVPKTKRTYKSKEQNQVLEIPPIKSARVLANEKAKEEQMQRATIGATIFIAKIMKERENAIKDMELYRTYTKQTITERLGIMEEFESIKKSAGIKEALAYLENKQFGRDSYGSYNSYSEFSQELFNIISQMQIRKVAKRERKPIIQKDIQIRLSRNIQLIDMEMLPQEYKILFNQKYQFVKHSDAVNTFPEKHVSTISSVRSANFKVKQQLQNNRSVRTI